MHYIVIINPKSGLRTIQRNVMRAIEKLKNDNFKISLFETQEEGDAERFAASFESFSGIDLVVAVGGDGTINEVINGLYVHQNAQMPPLAIIPAGTVNDFGNHLKMPSKENDIYKYLKAFRPTFVDIGEVNGRYFTNVVAAGYISDVGYKVQRKHKKRFGRFAYYSEGVIEAVRYLKKTNRFSFVIGEHKVSLDAYMFIALNTSCLGGLTYFAPGASVEDGFLDLFIIKKTGLLGGFILLLKILLGKHVDDQNVIYFKVRSFRVEANEALDVDIDGEKGTKLPLEVKVHRQFLKLALPES